MVRLLNVRDLTFRTFTSTDVPRYVVASHRWSAGSEVSLKDVVRRRNTGKDGYKKVEGYARYINDNITGIDWLWIDTCCVNQDSSQEVSEAVNAMFRWFSNAELCLAFLADVKTAHDPESFRRSSWFRRGWTLQELIAPPNIVFLSQDWQVIGHRSDAANGLRESNAFKGVPLEATLTEITGIPEKILRDGWRNDIVGAEEIFRWMANRETTKEEDLSYCLLGLFDVSLPVLYGEGKVKARERLIAEITRANAPRQKRLTGATSSHIDVGTQNTNSGIGGKEIYDFNEGWYGRRLSAGAIGYNGNAGEDVGADRTPPTATEVEPVKAWLNAASSKVIQNHCLACRTDGTCQWILNRPEISMWLRPLGAGSTLWLHAPPGFGKSITFAALAEHLERDHFDIVLTCFCSATDDTLRVPTNILRTCLTQAILRRRDFCKLAANIKRKSDAQVASEAELEQLLSTIIKLEPGLVIMIDGYDECLEFETDYHRRCGRDRAGFLRRLCRMVSHTSSRLIIVSRDEDDIRSALCYSGDPSAEAAVVEYRIHAEDVHDDIRRFSEQQVQSFKSLKNRSEDLQIEITQSLTDNSGGMFLWVRLQSMQLAAARNVAVLRKQISGKPRGLDEFYERDWQRIQAHESAERDRSLLILRWVTFAVRPLSSRELFEAIAIESHGSGFVLSEDCLPDQIVTDELTKSELLEPCKPFLVLQRRNDDDSSDDSDVIQVAHFSMKTFLLEKFTGQSASASSNVQDDILAQSCIGYLAAGLPWIEITIPDEGMRSHPLLMYAVQNWMVHLDATQNSNREALKATKILFNPQNSHWIKWRDLFERITEDQDVAYIAEDLDLKFVPVGSGSRSYYAALFGLRDALEQNIRATPAEVNALGGRYGTPLQAACVQGRAELASILLSAGADPNTRSGLWGSALNAAVVVGNEDIVSTLLQNRVDLGLTDGFGRGALYLAARENDIKVVKLLLEQNINPGIANHSGWTPINLASDYGHVEVVKLLLAQSQNVNLETANDDGWTPINSASDRGYIEVVKLLLAQNVNLETANNDGWTPINSASYRGYIEVVKLLLAQNVNLETANNDGWTPVHSASSAGHVEVVKLLLERNANLETANIGEWTPINSASNNGHVEVVKLLLEQNANLETASERGFTPIHSASNNGHVEVVELLLKQNVNLETTNDRGSTPIHSASNNGHVEIVKLLLKQSVNLKITSNNGWTLVNTASSNGHVEVVKLLLEQNVDLETANSSGWTPINVASNNGYTEVVKLLLEQSVDLEAANETGQTPLYSAALCGHARIVDLLLKAGAICTAQNKDDYSVLNIASSGGHVEVVRLLLTQQLVDLEAANILGDTPLYSAVLGGHARVVDLLLKAGARCTVQNRYNWSIVTAASASGHVEVLKLLLRQNVDLATTVSCGRTPISVAANNGHIEVVKLLLEQRNVDLKAADQTGDTPLYCASLCGHVRVVKLLLKAGADVNARGKRYGDALHAASHRGHEKVARMLLDARADVNAEKGPLHLAIWAAIAGGHDRIVHMLKEGGAVGDSKHDKLGRSLIHISASYGNRDGIMLAMADVESLHALDNQQWTALHWAAYFGMADIARLLVQHGANVDCRDSRGWTPSQVAAFSGHLTVAHLMTVLQPQYRTEDSRPAPGRIWRGSCDSCTHELVGDQYRCTECPGEPGYDLCFRCVRDAEIIHPQHDFTKYGSSSININDDSIPNAPECSSR